MSRKRKNSRRRRNEKLRTPRGEGETGLFVNVALRQYVDLDAPTLMHEEDEEMLACSWDPQYVYEWTPEKDRCDYVDVRLCLPDRSDRRWIFVDHELRRYAMAKLVRSAPRCRSKVLGYTPTHRNCESRPANLGIPAGYVRDDTLISENTAIDRYFAVNETLCEYETRYYNGNDGAVLWPTFGSWIGQEGLCYVTAERPESGYKCLDKDGDVVRKVVIVNDDRREYAIFVPSSRQQGIPYRWESKHYDGAEWTPDWQKPEGYAEVPPVYTFESAEPSFLINHTTREYVDLSNCRECDKTPVMPPTWKPNDDEIETRKKPPKRYTMLDNY
jgi:hypothetical protein